MPELDNDIILEIIGKGPYKKELVKLARELGVEVRVVFRQDLARKDLLQEYAEADLFVSLSEHEAFGISIAEALASKLPCLVANTSASWVGHGCFGIDFPIDVNKLVNLIKEVIGTQVVGVKVPDWDESVKKLEDVYIECTYLATPSPF